MIILGSLKKPWELNSHLSLDYLILYNSYKSAWSNLNTCFSYTPQAKSAKLGWGGKKKREDLGKNIKTESKLASIWKTDAQQVSKAR